MSNRNRIVVAVLVASCLLAPVAAGVLYAVNPQGARSLDPRERILGIGLYRVPGESMRPSFPPGSIVATRASAADLATLRRGDVVAFMPPHHPDQVWLKRVIALAGETVELREGRVFVDGRELDEPYVSRERVDVRGMRDFGPHRVRAGGMFLLGDNRDRSEDSRYWGDADLTALRGIVR